MIQKLTWRDHLSPVATKPDLFTTLACKLKQTTTIVIINGYITSHMCKVICARQFVTMQKEQTRNATVSYGSVIFC